MVVPEQISRNRITTHGFGHLNPVPPVLFWNPGRVHLPADQLQGFAIEQEIIFPQGKTMRLLGKSGNQVQQQESENNDFFHTGSFGRLWSY